MTVIVVGIIILIIGFVAAKADEPMLRKYRSMIKTAGVIVILIGMSIACVIQVEPGQVGVQKLFGKVSNNILESGLNIINPVSYTHLRAHETVLDLVCRLLLEKK